MNIKNKLSLPSWLVIIITILGSGFLVYIQYDFIKYFYLSDGDLKDIDRGTKSLILKSVDMKGSGLADLPPALESLDLRVPIDAKMVSQIKHLKLRHLSFHLEGTEDGDFLKYLPQSLESVVFWNRIDIENARFRWSEFCALNKKGLYHLLQLPLKMLAINDCFLTAESYNLLSSSSLKELALINSGVTDADLLKLPKTLQVVGLSYEPKVTNKGMEALVKHLISPEHLSLYRMVEENEKPFVFDATASAKNKE